MGEWFQTIVAEETPLEQAANLAETTRTWLISEGIIEAERTDCVLGNDLGHRPGPNYEMASDPFMPFTQGLRTLGLEILVGREVFAAPNDYTLTCARCGQRIKDEEFGTLWQAIGEWRETSGDVSVACPRCQHTERVERWHFDPPIGFGNLAFQFWNWPPLKKSFVAELSERVGLTVLIEGKL